jgi:TP901 family phage tail tape measure protein
MADNIDIPIEASGEDGINRLTSAIDKLTASLGRLGNVSGPDLLKQQVEALQASATTGFAEISAKMEDYGTRVRAERQKSEDGVAADLEKSRDRQLNADRVFLNAHTQNVARQLEVDIAFDAARRAAAEKRATIEEASVTKQLEVDATFTAALAAQRARQLEVDIAFDAAVNAATEKRLAVAAAAAEKQRALNASFASKGISQQISTAEQAAVYSSQGGNAAATFGGAAAGADIAALRAQMEALTAQQIAAKDSAKLLAAAQVELGGTTRALVPTTAALAAAQSDEVISTRALEGAFRGAAHEMGLFGLAHGQILALLAGAGVAVALHQIAVSGAEVQYSLASLTALSTNLQPVDVNKFIQISSGTLSSLKDAAEGVHALAQAGFTTTQAFTALPDVLRLSALGELSVAQAAESAVESMHAFGKETTDLGNIVDTLTSVASKSNVSVKVLSEGLKSAATTGELLGFSFNETIAAVAALEKRGLTIQPLASGLTALYEPSKKVSEALKANDIDLKNADGSFKSLTETITILAQKSHDVKEFGELLKDIGVSPRAQKAFEALKDPTDYLEGLKSATEAAGFAFQATAVKADTVEGQFKRLASTTEGTLQKAFQDSAPALESILLDLEDLAKSDGVLTFLKTLTTTAAALTQVLVSHAGAILTAVAAYAGFKILSGLVTSFEAFRIAQAAAAEQVVATTIAVKAQALALGANEVQAAASAARAVELGSAGVTAGAGLTVAARGAQLFTTALGWIGVALTVATVAYEAYNALFPKTDENQQKALNTSRSLHESYQQEIDRLKSLEEQLKLTGETGLRSLGAVKLAALQLQQTTLTQQIAVVSAQPTDKGFGGGRGELDQFNKVSALKSQLADIDKLIAQQKSDISDLSKQQASATQAQDFAALQKRVDLLKADAAASSITAVRAYTPEIAAIAALGTTQENYAGKLLLVADAEKKLKDAKPSAVGGKDKSGEADALNAQLAQAALAKEILKTTQQTATLNLEAQKASGQIGELEYLRQKNTLTHAAADADVAQARADIDIVKGTENKRAAEQKYRNEIEVGRRKGIEADLQLQIAEAAAIDKLNKDNLTTEADTFKKRGDLLNAYIIEYEAKYGNLIKGLKADLATDPLARAQQSLLSAQTSEEYAAALKEYAAALKEYNSALAETIRLNNLAQEKSAGVAGAIFGASRQQFNEQLASVQEQLAQAKATAQADGGLSGALGLADVAKQINSDTVPALQTLVTQLKAVAAESKNPDLLKQASEAGKALATLSLEAGKAAQPFGDAWTKVWKDLDTSAHNAWLHIGSTGESIFTQLGHVLKTTVLDVLYQLTIKQWIINIGAALGSSGGGGVAGGFASLFSGSSGGGAGGGGGLGTLGGLLNLSSTAKNIYSAFTATGSGTLGAWLSGASSVSPFSVGLANASGVTGGDALGTLIANEGWSTGAGAGAAGAAGSSAAGAGAAGTSGLGAFGGIAAGAAGGVLGGNYISGGYSAIGGSSTNATATGTAIGAAVGSVVPVIGTALGALIGGLLGGVFNRAFGHQARETTDVGVRGTLTDTSVTGESYQNWLEKGGWFTSDRRGTETQGLTSDFQNSLLSGLVNLKTLTEGFGKTLGVSTDALAGYSKQFDIKLDAKDPSKNAQAITDFFTQVSNELATKLIPNISDFSKVGETAGTTLERLGKDFQATTAIAQLLGKTSADAFGQVGLASVAAREQFINLSGGLDTLSSKVSSYAQNYLSDSERSAPVIKALDEAFASLNVKAPTTREEFKNLVSSLDLTNASQVKLFNSLLDLSDAFAQVHAATVVVTKSVQQIADERKGLQDQLDAYLPPADLLAKQRAALDDSNRALFDQIQAHKDIQAAYDSESKALQDTITNSQSFVDTLQKFKGDLLVGSQSPLTPQEKYEAAKQQFDAAAKAAQGGAAASVAAAGGNAAAQLAAQTAAQSNFTSAANAFLQASQVANASSNQYVADFQYVREVTDKTQGIAQTQVDVATASLTALTQQVAGLAQINASVLTVAQAIKELSTAGGFTAQNAGAQQAAVESLYESLLKRHGDQAGLDYWTKALSSGANIQDIAQQFEQSPEYQKLHATPVTSARVLSGDKITDVSNMTDIVVRLDALIQSGAQTAAQLKDLQAAQQEIAAAQIDANFQANQLAAKEIVDATNAAAKSARAAQDSRVIPA